MATYAIGDVQGCWETLQALLERISFSPERDRLIFVGDLVNRGPGSLQVVRWTMRHANRATVVLGNHDLHLIGRWLGVTRRKRRDTLEELLAAPDAEDIVAWLRRRPLAHHEAGHLVVHGGLLPSWTAERAIDLAREAEGTLRSDEAGELIQALREKPARRFEDEPSRFERVVAIVQALTMLRTCAPSGRPRLDYSGPPDGAPEGCLPWFAIPDREEQRVPVVFGHWAALGLHFTPLAIGIDSGAVWGNRLTALRLEDHRVFQEPTRDAPLARDD